MRIILHAGAHCTDDGRLHKCLLRNRDDFRKRGVSVPGPRRYRQILRESVGALEHGVPDPGAREVLLDEICDDDPDGVDRLILSNPNFFSLAKGALSHGEIYPNAVGRLSNLQTLFAEDRIELFFALRNPASWLPAMFAVSGQQDVGEFLDGVEPGRFMWSDMIARIQSQVPGIDITVWCNEDTPLIWGEIMRAMAGLEEGEKITGAFDLLAEIMSPEGMQRFRDYLKAHPAMRESQKRRVMTAFLDKYYLEEEVEEELDLPGWTDETVEQLTERYEADVDALAARPGIRFISA